MRFQRHAIWAAALLLPVLAQASNTVSNVSVLCSDTLTMADTAALNWQCTGDLSLSGEGDLRGSLSSDLGITLSASGSLTLTRMDLVAPSVTLLAGTSLLVDATNSINTGNGLLVTPGAPIDQLVVPPTTRELRAGGDIVVNGRGAGTIPGIVDTDTSGAQGAVLVSSVPEPASWKLGLLGLLMMGWLRRRTR